MSSEALESHVGRGATLIWGLSCMLQETQLSWPVPCQRQEGVSVTALAIPHLCSRSADRGGLP